MSGKADKDGVIYLPGEQSAAQPEPAPSFDELTPREIVAELDKYIVGQTAAKRAVAIALRNRVRRQKLQPEAAEERVLDLLLPPTPVPGDGASRALEVAHQEQVLRTREKLRGQLREGKLD